MPFVVKKTLKLDFLGEEWAGAELIFNAMSFRETRGLADVSVESDNPNSKNNKANFDAVAKILQEKFVSGTAWNGTAIVPIEGDEILDLPVEAINKSISTLVGTSPN